MSMAAPMKATVTQVRDDRQAVLLTETGWEILVLVPPHVRVLVGMRVLVTESPSGPPVVQWGV